MSGVSRCGVSIDRSPASPSAGVAMAGLRARQEDSSRRNDWCTVVGFLFFFTLLPIVQGQEPLQRKEQFVPADQLDTVFDRDRRGVMMKRDEFKALLAKAKANSATQNIPIPIITEQANITVTPGDQQAMVQIELKVRQYAEGWQILRLRAGNLLVEKVEIDGQPALIARDPADPTALMFAHEKAGEFTVVATMSTQLVTLGSDRSAAFELPVVPAVQLTVNCPAGRHLMVNDLKLDRPAADDAVANYVVPVGNAPDVRLRWVVQRKESDAQTLVFVRTDGQLQIQKETLRWESDSRVSVFGGSINKVVARVPSRLEVTSVESTGLEAWNLEDDPENAEQTRVTLTYRQPFTNDRLIKIRAVAATASVIDSAVSDGTAAAMQKIPTLQFSEVTTHTGRLVVTHEDGLRLVSETGGGVRPMSAAELGLSTEASVFDFWLQEFELKVAAKPRDRELFAESNGTLAIDDTSATFDAALAIETLNAPLFEVLLNLPPDWQLTGVSISEIANLQSQIAGGVTWTNGGEPNQILVKPQQPVSPGQVLPLVLKLSRTIGDPDTEQKLALPVVTAAETTTVGGTYLVRFADDLIVSPLSLTGLTPVAGSGTEQVFQNLGTNVSGELSITRKPARLAARSVLKTWADSRQQSLDAEIITDVLNGTIRTLTIRVSEALGPDVRFQVRSVGPVPGITPTRAIRQVTIIEQSAGTPAEGLRPFTLKLDHRFAGSLSLHAFVQQPRTDAAPIAAPIVQVQDAVRQHGVLVFEASPEQQLAVGPEARSIPGLFVADAGLVDAPEASTGRRVALTYRFVQPGYAFQVNETRFVTNPVPSAVCEQLANVCTLNDSGSIQRWCQAKIRSSGVQTLRFTLPGGKDHSFLWSTMLNGEPVEVRSEAGDYLVAVPANSESQQQTLTVLFESDARQAGAFGQTNQGPVQFSFDAGDQQAIPIDVLLQSWRVHYPQSSLLVDSDGQFRPTAGVDQPGWLVSIGEIDWPKTSELPRRLIPLAIFFLVLFVLTVMVSRRRWKTLAAVGGIGVVLFMLTLSKPFVGRSSDFSRNRQSETLARTAAPSAYGMAGGYSYPAGQPMVDAMSGGLMRDDLNFSPPAPGMPGGMGGAIAPTTAPDNVDYSIAVPAAPMPAEGASMDPFAQPPAPAPADESQPAVTFMEQALPPGDGGWADDRGLGSGGQIPKKGSARLSVNVNLDVPDDYQVREFVSVADSVHQESTLSLVVQRRGQIAAIRMLAAMVVILLAWRMRKAAALWKLTVSIVLLLSALALLPLLSNAWQSVLDGVVIGSVISAAMALVCGCCCLPLASNLQRRLATIRSPGRSLNALIILIAMPALTSIVGAQDVETPHVVVPYSPDEPALRADQVFIRHDDFLKLYQQANPDALKARAVSPLGSTVVATFLKTGALTQVDGSKQVLSFDGRFVVWNDSDQAASVPLPIGPVAIRSLLVDGQEGSVQPLVVGAQGTEIQNFAGQQIQATRQAPAPTAEGPAYAVSVTGKGWHVVDVKFDISALVEGDLGRADLPLRSAAVGTLEWTLPADGLDAKIHGRTNVYRREGRTVIVPIAQLSTIRLQWLPTVQKLAGDVVFHSTVASTLAVQDSGMMLRTTVSITVRQGEVSELDVTIPEGYSVQTVTGEDVAGWTAQSTDATRSVKLQLRRAVNDATKVTIQLYAPAAKAEVLAALAVPISMVRGASRDLGTVILKAGSQFQVRSDSLSAVTQINPSEAPTPEGDELPGRPMLAWRYTRHPAAVTVKVTPTADELSTDSVHAVRLEEQRQLWSSRMTLQITGAPRSRVDIQVPHGFLALDVSATALKDWYFVNDAGADADSRTLSIQFTDARSGLLQIAVQGQMSRDADRSLLRLMPPTVMNAAKATSQLAVWLDAASENSGFESGVGNGGDWTVKSPAAAQGSYQEISPMPPSLAFQSNAARPGALAVKLRQAVSVLFAGSVTVTNVTETAIEITMALNWAINRAAADHFAVELPTSVASIMTFEIPGQRRVTREDLGNGKTRVMMQLQQPVTDRLFVLGTASLPLPADKVIRSEMPNIIVPQGAPSTLSGQGHYWVLVNQSNGLLQPTAEQPEDKVSSEQIQTKIQTQIPPQLLQQAVAVVKLRPETAVWNLVYPEQFQVAPAVVNLATHTTVISDDGSWRSRHQLQVTNESRQFLPVVLPKGSRLMYCLVQGRPSRVVTRGEGKDQRHLIPIPQSGALASGFEVEFALAGLFDDSAAQIRKEWSSRRLLIPVPTFPEFRDDPEFGISVSRNRWSVYVPDSWRATLVEDPDATNVVKADSEELEDASLMSDVEQAATFLKSAKNAKGMYLQSKVLEQLQNATVRLNRMSGKDSGVERQRGELLSKLSELNSAIVSNGQAQQIQPPVFGNRFLYEQESLQNGANDLNVDQFWAFNKRTSDSKPNSGSNGINNPDGQPNDQRGTEATHGVASENRFRFGITLEDQVEEQLQEQDKTGEEKAKRESAKKQMAAKPKSADEESELTKTIEDGEMQPGKAVRGRSRLMLRRGVQSEAEIPIEAKESELVPSFSINALGVVPQQAADPLQVLSEGTESLANQPAAAPGRTATPTGLLSLKFNIPTDGLRIDFLRVGGNPTLALDVRSTKSVSKGTGLIWLTVCAIGILMLLGPGRSGKVLIFWLRLCLILTVSGLVAWLFTTGDLKASGLLICVVGAIGVSIVTAAINIRRVA